MDADYPAAHSMDTTWFAVDRDGRVAVFESGEDGHVPDHAAGDNVLHDLWDHLHPAATPQERDTFWDEHWDDAGATLGFFTYDYGGEYVPIGLYERAAPPERPLHVDQLPPALRRVCKAVRFESVSFVDAKALQPLQYFACIFWYDEDRVGYLCDDGITVRPVRGREERFAEFVRSFRAEHTDVAARFRFEGPGG